MELSFMTYSNLTAGNFYNPSCTIGTVSCPTDSLKFKAVAVPIDPTTNSSVRSRALLVTQKQWLLRAALPLAPPTFD